MARIIESASRLGIEINREEAQTWIDAMEVESQGGDVVVDVNTGVFGHRASMLDLNTADLERFKKIAPIVGSTGTDYLSGRGKGYETWLNSRTFEPAAPRARAPRAAPQK